MKFLLTLLLLFSSPCLFAQEGRDNASPRSEQQPEAANPAIDPGCPRRNKLSVICSEVNSRSEAYTPIPGSKNNYYNYYKSIHEAACVLDTDSPEVAKYKIRDMWDKLAGDPILHCTDSFFEVPRGNLIKYGVAMNFDRFIRDVTRWGVDLNWVDESDGRTALDYVGDMMAKYRGNTHEAKLQMYYNQLRKAGAKHESEL